MIIKMKRAIFVTTLFLSFVLCFFVLSEKIMGQGLDISEVNIKMVPETPKAGDSVYVYLTSFATNIDSATITWKVNNKTIKTGVGEKIFNFTMGPEGQVTTLDIVVRTTDSVTIQRNIKIRPASVDLVWESHGFVPPFYKGKALFAHQNKVTVIALPNITGQNGSTLNPKNLVYRWKRNGSVIESASGYGKNSITLEGSIISRPVTVTVEVGSDSFGEAYNSIVLRPIEPELILYKNDPIYGIEFQKALSTNEVLKNSNEISIFSSPFFFDSNDSKSGYLVYNWAINGSKINGNGSPSQVFRQIEGTSGTSRVSLSVENPSKPLQFTSKSVDLTFNNKQ